MDRAAGALAAGEPGTFARCAGFGAAGDRAFMATSAVLFVASAAGTIAWCGSMSGGMPMPGGWTMSMAWMRMPGQNMAGAAASFLVMWALMMVAMMLPSLVPMLAGFRRALRAAGETRLGRPTVLAAAGYFLVWTAVGAASYPIGFALAAAEMRRVGLALAVPAATGCALVLAGCLQLSGWKARRLRCCREAPGCAGMPVTAMPGALPHGVRLGVGCALCCSGFMLVLLVGGVMDLGVMGAVALAITAERLAPWPVWVARASGFAIVAAGLVALAR